MKFFFSVSTYTTSSCLLLTLLKMDCEWAARNMFDFRILLCSLRISEPQDWICHKSSFGLIFKVWQIYFNWSFFQIYLQFSFWGCNLSSVCGLLLSLCHCPAVVWGEGASGPHSLLFNVLLLVTSHMYEDSYWVPSYHSPLQVKNILYFFEFFIER